MGGLPWCLVSGVLGGPARSIWVERTRGAAAGPVPALSWGMVDQPEALAELLVSLDEVPHASPRLSSPLPHKVLGRVTDLCLSMSAARPFGPYTPDATMLNLCRRTAETLWHTVRDVKAGQVRLDDVPFCAGFHPLCDWCDHADGCPKFTADPVNDPVLDQALAEFAKLKSDKAVLEEEIEIREGRIRQFCGRASNGSGWLSTPHFRFKTSRISGRKTIDPAVLRAELTNRIGVVDADALMARVTTTGNDYERLFVSPIKSVSV